MGSANHDPEGVPRASGVTRVGVCVRRGVVGAYEANIGDLRSNEEKLADMPLCDREWKGKIKSNKEYQ